MFGKAKLKNYNIWNSLNPGFQCSESPKFRIPITGKAKVQNSNDWKS